MIKPNLEQSLIVLFIAIVLLIAATIPNQPTSITFTCNNNPKVTLHRAQNGFPLVFFKQAVAGSNCVAVGDKGYGALAPRGPDSMVRTVNPSSSHERIDIGYIIEINLLLDFIIWLLISASIYFIYKRHSHHN